MAKVEVANPLKAIRQKCLDCCNDSAKYVKFCTEDGLHSTWCPLWPYRFGMRPRTAARRYGVRLMDPEQMPSADVPLEDCQ